MESPVPAWGVWVIRPGPWIGYKKERKNLCVFFLYSSATIPSPNDYTVKVDTYLKNSHFSASNREYYNSLAWFQIFEYIPRILCVWDPNDRTVQVDTYLKILTFLRRMLSVINLSTHFGFSSVYPGFWVYETMITQKVDTYLKNPIFSASNGKCHNSLGSFRIFDWILKV